MNNIPESEFKHPSAEALDLEALFVAKMNLEAVQIGEYYRQAALVFRLCKPESRILLKRLIARGLARKEGQTVVFLSDRT